MGRKPSAAPIRAVRPLEGGLPLRTFEEYRSAGRLVRRELDDAERLRRELLHGRTAPRRFPPDFAGRLLAVWNAYVLQMVGEHLLDAVRVRSLGAVRPEASARILAFLGPAGRWMSQAAHAAADASYRVEERVHLPAEPPGWPNRTYGPYPLSTAMAAALRAVHARAGSTLADHVRAPVGDEEDLFWLRWLLDNAAAAIEYTEQPDLDEPSWSAMTAAYLRYALRMLFLFGQVAAMPALLDARDPTTVVSLVARGPSRTDIWSLTDPGRRTLWRSRPSARAAVEKMWAANPRPGATVRVQAQIDAAFRTGAIVFATDRTGERLGCLYRCPWPAVYEVRRPVTIGGTHLLPMEHFTFDALGEGHGQGGRIVVSVFVPADAAVG
ncbi:hypothetical protein GCM10023191_099000 [Actinoallomurus oryzae]|uniref:Uncharacterized protein n=1 Tax=Actinoallomurus oryzae TaxID=502180 RepID=A0ABP8R8F3_9ACTN